MAVPRPSLCITCGLDAGPTNTLNRLEDGRVCPTCSARLLDFLPPLIPGFGLLSESRFTRRRAANAITPGMPTVANGPKKARRVTKRSK